MTQFVVTTVPLHTTTQIQTTIATNKVILTVVTLLTVAGVLGWMEIVLLTEQFVVVDQEGKHVIIIMSKTQHLVAIQILMVNGGEYPKIKHGTIIEKYKTKFTKIGYL
jgi:hypothetical protein